MNQTLDAPRNSQSISETLREARLAKGLELNQVAELTHVRKEHLEAMEAGDFAALPEPIYARNFLKLFANAVGLDGAAMVARYQNEIGAVVPSRSGSKDVAAGATGTQDSASFKETRRFAIGDWLPGFLLIAAVVAVVLWLFNTFLFNPTQNARVTPLENASQTDTLLPTETAADLPADDTAPDTAAIAATPEEAASTEASGTPAPASAPIVGDVLFSLTTEPAGAEVSIDNYVLPGTTPIVNAPISAGRNRTLSVTLAGYEPVIESIDLAEDLQLSLSLATPQATEILNGEVATLTDPASDSTVTPDDTAASAPPAAAGEGVLVITVDADTWVEAYSGNTRGEGERLVYQTLAAGESRAFDLPVYLHVGNAGGVELNLNGTDIGSMGSSGEVLGRAFIQ